MKDSQKNPDKNQPTCTTPAKKEYSTPVITLIEVSVEQGFANSPPPSYTEDPENF